MLYQVNNNTISNNFVNGSSGSGLSSWGGECFNNVFHKNIVYNSNEGLHIDSDDNLISTHQSRLRVSSQ